jgi:class 3 adenylate cyclase/tetratricopeptide (TPR) repeat protein
MRCPDCGAESPADKKFCGDCGAPLTVACPSCGLVNPRERQLCDGCGSSLAAPGLREAAAPWVPAAASRLPGEIKQLTVMFCDIVNSTPLTERLGAEAMRDLIARFIDAAVGEVHRYGGTAPQFSGDGFMALFGAPQTQEDHVRRALLAALAIRRVVTGDDGLDGASRLDLEIRIGIHTGPAVFGRIGGSFGVETVIGDTANVAARLQQAAAPGTVLVSEAVRALARGYASFEPVGPLDLKGKSVPVAGFRLIAVSRSRAARDAVAPARLTRFVGRDADLARLHDLLLAAEAGRGQVVGIVGEPGIGKSRLLTEFRRGIGDERVTWVEGRCLSYGAGIPYLLALDLLRSYCGIGETDSAAAIAQKLRAGLGAAGMDDEEDSPVLLHLLGLKDVAGGPALANPEAIKAKSFEVLQRLCLDGSRRRTLVLALEDLHWIDTISQELLAALAERIGNARILIVACYRPEYWPSWAGKLKTAEIPLQPLSRDDSLHVVHSVLQDDAIASPLAEEIVARADGNPLFLEQLALHAGEAEGGADLAVPQTIHGVVMARIDRLPQAEKQLLQTAAVIGREFSLRLLRAVWSGREPLEPGLRELARLEFLDEWPDDESTSYVFRHVLTQEAAYSSLLERDRRHQHEDIAHALEQLYKGRNEEVAELLALHFGRSDNDEKAVDYAIAAAEKSQRRWANNEALAYFEDALRRLDALPDSPSSRLYRIDAVLKQAEVKFALGRHAEHIQALDGIRNIINQADNPLQRATWHYWTGYLHSLTGGRPDIAIQHCREAAAIASAAGLDEIEAFAKSCLAQVYVIAGRLHQALEIAEEALSIFEARGNLWWAGRALGQLTWAANALGQWDNSLSYCRRMLEHGNALNDLRLKTLGWWRMASAYVQQGDLVRCFECCENALSLAPTPYDTAMVRAVRGYAEIKAGRVDVGITELTEAAAWFDSSHLRHSRLRLDLWLSEGQLKQGDRASARPLLQEVLQISREAGYLYFEALACWLMAECFATDMPSLAEDYVATAIDILERIDARNDLAKAMVTEAVLRQRNGDTATARRLLERAHAIFSVLSTRDELARVSRALAALDRR